MFATYAASHVRLVNDRIFSEDGHRQERTAADILARLERQPGLVLADEVGMGKTFVALAVAASILLERPDCGPVVVMVPPSLKEKWPRDWEVFREKCLVQPLRERFRAASAASGVAFLKLLDDPPERRSQLIFLTHGALHRAIGDAFAKLAVIKRAFKGRSSLSAQRRNFPRFAGRLLGLGGYENLAKGLIAKLLDRPYDTWLRVIHGEHSRFTELVKDDPVPRHLQDALEAMRGNDLAELVEKLRNLPFRESKHIDERLRDIRHAIRGAMEDVWKMALRTADFRSPLLILDEAHHVKNPETMLASLFVDEEAARDSDFFESGGPLGGKFERMLFLTATPFQLGHRELIRILERFEGVVWKTSRAPVVSRSDFSAELRELSRTLDDAQASALRLDHAWSRLERDHLGLEVDAESDLDAWWAAVTETGGVGLVHEVARQVASTRESMRAAERALAPWVLRHLKSPELPGGDVARRLRLPGAAIRDGSPSVGLEIGDEILLPFLLAGRAQGLLSATARGRALFAEGLASSFEAYLETRDGAGDPEEDPDDQQQHTSAELEWYLRHLDRALPRGDLSARLAHPKILATAERAVDLWRRGEKVLIFCHYRATGRALRQHISSMLLTEIERRGRERLGHLQGSIHDELDAIGQRFFDADGSLRAAVTDALQSLVQPFKDLGPEQAARVVDVVRRFIRTPSFLVRYFDLQRDDTADAFAEALEREDIGSLSLRRKITDFCQFLCERCIASERQEYLDALDSIQTGSHVGKDVRAAFDPSESSADDDGRMLLPNVRLANGLVRQETRRRLLQAFNTPLFPEILIASSVLAEGVDLHLSCRYVIHHDLCWNPSTLEQRTGRVDRIGSKAERVGQSINVYLPYVAATQDEKMFRVVRDRERWFQIVMGERYEVDEAATDRVAERVPLPESVRRQLVLRLHS